MSFKFGKLGALLLLPVLSVSLMAATPEPTDPAQIVAATDAPTETPTPSATTTQPTPTPTPTLSTAPSTSPTPTPSATPVLKKPGVPRSVKFTKLSDDSVRLTWAKPTSGGVVANYTVKIVNSSGTSKTTKTTSTSLTVQNLKAAAKLTATIYASNASGKSATAGATYTVDTPAPTSPREAGLVLVPHDSGKSDLRVEWTKPATTNGDLTHYVVKLYSGSKTTPDTTRTVDAKGTKTTFLAADYDTVYYATVTAVNIGGSSNPAKTNTVKTPPNATPTPTPTITTPAPTQTGQPTPSTSATPGAGGSENSGPGFFESIFSGIGGFFGKVGEFFGNLFAAIGAGFAAAFNFIGGLLGSFNGNLGPDAGVLFGVLLAGLVGAILTFVFFQLIARRRNRV